MLIPLLITTVVVLAVALYYVFFLAPRINPYNRAQKFLDQGLLEQAAAEYGRILERKPYDVFVHYRLADIYLEQDQADLAAQHLEEIVKADKYTVNVEKKHVLKKLGRIYLSWDEIEKAFQAYIDILKVNPADQEALYQAAFISLAHGYFELSYRYFEKLAPLNKKSFEIQFGAGVACLQNQKTGEALGYFKDALATDPLSDIGNIAMAYSLLKRRDFKTGANYAKMVVQNSSDDNALFVARRLMGILLVQAGKSEDAVKSLQDTLDLTRKRDMKDEEAMILYDLGFACLKSEKTDMAYEYWNQLYKIDKNYKDVQKAVMILRREMDEEGKKSAPAVFDSLFELSEKWAGEAFPDNYVYSICGLKSERTVDLGSVSVTARIPAEKTPAQAGEKKKSAGGSIDETIAAYLSLDPENFRIISNRVVAKLGYGVDEILPTYRDADGVDFMGHSNQDRSKTLIWVRRWKGTNVGEIPLRNFAQAVNDAKAKQGIFITTSELTENAEDAIKRLGKISVVYPEQLGVLLADLL